MGAVEVIGIQIKYPDGEVKQLSIEDAKVLYLQLAILFGNKTVLQPSSRLVIERDRWPCLCQIPCDPHTASPPPRHLEVWCCTESVD